MARDVARMDAEPTASDADPTAAVALEPPPNRPPLAWRELRARAVRALGAPLLATTAVAIVLLTFFQPAFLTNDDTAVEAVINGDFTGKRSSALVIVPAIFGHILRVFYFLIPHLNWYAISLYTLQIVAWSVIAAMAFTLQRRPPLAERIVVGAIACAVLPWMILRIGYTPTSIFIGVAGILSFAAGALAPGRLGLLYTIVGGVFVGVVDFVRVTSLLGLLALFAPLLVVIAYKTGLRRSITFGLIVLSFMIVGYGTTKLEYARTPQWRAFIAMNGPRGQLSQTPRLYNVNVSDAALAKIGWTRNDLFLFADDEYPDPTVYSDKSIEELAKESPLVRRATSVKYVYDTLRNSSDDKNGPVVSGLVALGILIALRRNRFVSAVIVASVVWAVAVLTVLLLYERLPGRIGVPFEAGAALLALIVPAYLFPSSESWPRTGGRPTFSSPAATAFVALVLLFTAGPVWRAIKSPSQMSSQDKSGLADVKDVLTRIELIDPKGIFVGGGNYFGRWFSPLTNTTQFTDKQVIPLGLTANSPLFTARLARMGVSDVYSALLTDPHVHFLGVKAEETAVQKFYLQHRHTSVKFVANTSSLPVQLPTIVLYVSLWSVVHTPAIGSTASGPAPAG